ncbi:MAG: hypothetical protein E7610_06550 [Ruminococcaceae bacterium]|nr:hypothetical protein [Oscillospiraceae bacterium]
MNRFKKRLALTLASLTLLSCFVSCADTDSPDDSKESSTVAVEADSSEDNRFLGLDYKDRPFRIYTSAHQASSAMDSSNYLIEGEGKTGGGMVSDAVYQRNVTVEELLGVKLEFTQCDLSYGAIAGDVRILTQSGDDLYDLVINDNYDYAQLVIEGHFRNLMDDECVFDFDRPYWYKDYMEDLRLVDGYQHLLAGDFFIDVLRTAHLMIVNKDIYQDYYRTSADELYDVVSNYEWTYDKLISTITGLYIDKNQSGSKDEGDQYGYLDSAYWGASIPLSTSGTTTFIKRDEEGCPTISIHEGDRSNQLAARITTLLNHEDTGLEKHVPDPVAAFINGEALVAATFSLGSLESENLRQMESDAAVLPYPMLFSSDKKYTTATHDTTELGAVLVTSKDMAFISTVIEVLNRETANILIPKYYKESLQVQCVDDEKAAAMIDIIHDNFDNAFILAYNTALGGKILQAFSTAAEDKREFSAVFASSAKSMEKTLKNKISRYRVKNNID